VTAKGAAPANPAASSAVIAVLRGELMQTWQVGKPSPTSTYPTAASMKPFHSPSRMSLPKHTHSGPIIRSC
jgi:hypothetical protein